MSRRMTKSELRTERDAFLAEIKASFVESKHPEVHEYQEAGYAYAEAEYALVLATPTKKLMALHYLAECGMRQVLAKKAMDELNVAMATEIFELQQRNAELEVTYAKLSGALPGEIERVAAASRAKLTLN
jgi:hypothetical protein